MKKRALFLALLACALLLACGSAWARSVTEEPDKPGAGAAPAGMYNEAPMLAALVAAGKLPPVDERLPDNPAVLTDPEDGVGKYGGSLTMFALGLNPWDDMGDCLGATPLMLSPDGTEIRPHIAEDYNLSDDGRTLTLTLRKGMKWSDGEEFTTEDWLFQFEDVLWEEGLTATWNRMPEVSEVIAVDDYTLQFISPDPYFTSVLVLADAGGIGWRFFKPKHYFSQWHGRYNDDAGALAKEEGFDTWQEALSYHMRWNPMNDIEQPLVRAFISTAQSQSLREYERNPYYWRVDTAGNQLPYIDTVILPVVDAEVYQLKIITGEADAAWKNPMMDNFPSYQLAAQEHGYKITLLDSPVAQEIAFVPNLNHNDPVQRAIYQNVKFRQALSVAINRDEINEAAFLGLATPRQTTVLPNATFYKPEWAEHYAQYDPALANRLLDQAGLDKKDRDGFRLRPDGQTLNVIIEVAQGGAPTGQRILELVKSYWDAVGVKTLLRFQEGTLLATRRDAAEHDMIAGHIDDQNEPTLWSYSIHEYYGRGNNFLDKAQFWGQWLDAQDEIALGHSTLADFGGELPGEEPPEWWKEYNAMVSRLATVKYLSAEYTDLMTKIFDWNMDQLLAIGTVGLVPYIYIAKEGLGNTVKEAWANFSFTGSMNMLADQLYWK